MEALQQAKERLVDEVAVMLGQDVVIQLQHLHAGYTQAASSRSG